MIYPAVKRLIKICAACFGICALVSGVYHLGLPMLMSGLNMPELAAWFSLSVSLYIYPLLIVSLSILCFWGARVLLAHQGGIIVRGLSAAMFFPAFLALCLPFSDLPMAGQCGYSIILRKIYFMLVAATAFFAYPYTAGYAPKDRKIFLCWAIAVALHALQDLFILGIFYLKAYHYHDRTQFIFPLMEYGAYAVIILCRAAFPLLSAVLAWRLYANVMRIISMPEKK